MISSRSAFLKKKMATNFQVAKILRFSLAFHKFLSSWFTHITHQIAQSRPLATGRIVPSSFLLCGEENESRKRFLLILSSQDEKFIHYCYDSDHSPFLKLNISAEDSPFFKKKEKDAGPIWIIHLSFFLSFFLPYFALVIYYCGNWKGNPE